LAPRQARASVFTVNVTQQSGEVDFAGSGSFDLTGLVNVGLLGPATVEPDIAPRLAILGIGPANVLATEYLGTISGPTGFGAGSVTQPSSGTGTPFELLFDIFPPPALYVPQGYVSGTAFTDTSVYSNATLSSLGIAPGTYTWTWNAGGNSLVLNAPEPASLSLLLISGLAVLPRRRW
jgi:hypothetical protein